MEVNNYGVRYGRLRTSDGQYISSSCIKRNNTIARNNYYAQIRRTIDKLAHRPNAPPQLAIKMNMDVNILLNSDQKNLSIKCI
ncbi:hypothetical protein GLOIN_2v1644898 [Rhizophagus clarus]|uniref:Uncharacterized protein n=1 Tax=Rhizophagus clarus TaxID=94130 RepID=A0A8H3QMY6_9GLOM|nr:hypothetical protein GLOIN_2v1644898 [Rhizophagus clarus]GES85683.1 hypothetical protein GLOIN_2v1644898 [Rhizophagus clarus]